MGFWLTLGFVLCALLTTVAGAQVEPADRTVDRTAIEEIRREGIQNSEVMELASWLTDVYGPRLTNSPIARLAGDWAIARMQKWGLSNPRYEWFTFGRGWINERNYVQVIAPVPYIVHAFPGAWTTGTSEPVKGRVVIVEVPANATAADYQKYRGTLRGKIVLASPPAIVTPMFVAPATRWTISELDSLASIRWKAVPVLQPLPLPAPNSPEDVENKFWLDEGVVAVLKPGFLRGNSGSVTGGGASRRPDWPVSVPRLGVSAEHYGRMYRQVKHGIEPIMELDIRNLFTDQLQSFNLIAELPGSDLREEVVMIGAHFDSWHLATGATDNAGQVAVLMEAMRILKSSKQPLRRTVRLALWTGEEQGLIGSRRYVERHFGEIAHPKREHRRLSAYFNLDFGAGAIRGIFAQGNTHAAAIFREWLTAIDSDSISTRHISMESVGDSDHIIFDAAGLPAFAFIQDAIDYNSRTHHSSQDFFERLIPNDLRHNAIVIASFAYLAANRNEPMPRKSGLIRNADSFRRR